MTRKRKIQYAALPYRSDERGDLEVLLITSRETGRWIIPKGWPIKKHEPHSAASLEAFEEAGAIGVVNAEAVGTYSYDKRLKNDQVRTCQVHVFPFAVNLMLDEWPEAHQRQRQWYKLDHAASLV
jgi:8-oxo-dGTP pyrophosphatase MutT (NUDIX family)